MRMRVLFLLLMVSCASQHPASPSWVEALRSGESSLKVSAGSKTLYRRIAGGPELTQDASCEAGMRKAEEDIRREYPLYPKIPYTVEVLWYDQVRRDCAVTLSLEKKFSVSDEELSRYEAETLKRKEELLAKETVSESEAAELINLRTEIAAKFSLSGLRQDEFEKFSREKVARKESPVCAKFFQAPESSLHGKIQVCWSREQVKGFCQIDSDRCFVRIP